MPPKQWLVLTVHAPSEESVPDLVDALVALGGAAVEEHGETLVTYLADPGDADGAADAARAALADAAGEPVAVEWRWQAHEDWAEQWKRGLGPRKVGERLIVAPTWAVPDSVDDAVLIVLDPEMAFGTGEHATTRGVLRLLQACIRAGDRVLDVGSGSGILAIAAVKLGAAEALGVELEAEAVEAAARNVARNDVADRVTMREGTVTARTLGETPGVYDLILANILSSVIIPLLPAFRSALRTGGRLLVSGILQTEAPAVVAAAEAAGFDVADEDREEEWWSARLEPAAG